jgi:hypothetical protein
VPARPDSLGQQRRAPLHPPVDGDVIDVDAALDQQFLDVAIGQAKGQVPADGDDDHLGREAKAGKADRRTGAARGRWWVLTPTGSPLERGHSECNSADRRGQFPLPRPMHLLDAAPCDCERLPNCEDSAERDARAVGARRGKQCAELGPAASSTHGNQSRTLHPLPTYRARTRRMR